MEIKIWLSTNTPNMTNPDSESNGITNEVIPDEGVPIDGRDVEGEETMKMVRNDKLEIPPPEPSVV